MTDAGQDWNGFEIAIIGMAGRFPGARDVGQLWRNLHDGVESIRRLTDEELLAAGEDPARLADPAYVRASAVLDDIDLFDAAFFSVTPREAELTDPQHRLFLEHAWAALEDAGYDPARPPGSVGVYGGTGGSSYLLKNLVTSGVVASGGLPLMFGNGNDYLTTRVSYKLDLKGPSFDVQTSCSSSLVAVHLASQALLSGECDMALAGGVGIVVPHGLGYVHEEQGIYSPDGHCRAFSSRAEGTVGGSGVALVVLRRLADAIEDGDTIRAVIKGSAINNDGSHKIGYAAPSIEGQSQVIRNALAVADVEPDTMSYVETHGTGTSLGDPIEIAALTAAYRSRTDKRAFCAIGSIKTNVGHLDAAAGVTGLIKASMALQHKQLPPSLNCDEPDPKIDFPSTPFHVNTSLTDWVSEGPRRAGVSSFGIGGTNAHVILQEAPAVTKSGQDASGPQLIVLSARTPQALDQASANLREHLLNSEGIDLADVAWTLQVGRKNFAHRRALVGRDVDDLCRTLESLDRQRVRNRAEEAESRPVVFLFPGQGAQYVQMGRELYECEPVFRDQVDADCQDLQNTLGLDLRSLLYPDLADAAAVESADAQLKQTWLTQPALFVIEHAMAQLFLSWGVDPAAMIGHSIGEYVAATLAGVFDRKAALELVAARGRLMQDLPEGGMLAVPVPADELSPRLSADLSIAAINEPGSCVVSGPAGDVAALAAELEADEVATQALHTSHAFHSSMMDPILETFAERVAAVSPQTPKLPFVSTLTGTWITDEQAVDPSYWARHLRGTVRFADGAAELMQDPSRVLLEVGPGNTLTSLGTRIARQLASGRESGRESDGSRPVCVQSMRHPRKDLSDRECLLDGLGQLWLASVPIDWAAVHAGVGRRRVPLPTYPFQRQRFWVEPGSAATDVRSSGKRPLVADWFYEPSWTRAPSFSSSATAPTAERVLVCSDGSEWSSALVERLSELGKTVSVATVGGAFADQGDGCFVLRPEQREDHDQLFAALHEQGRRPELVLHLWSLDPAADSPEQVLDRGVFSLLSLAQAAGNADGLQILVATRAVVDVLGGEELCPERAAVLGICQSITQELAGIDCRAVDLGADTPDVGRVDDLLRELSADDGSPVAWRGTHRWVSTCTAVSLPAETEGPLRRGGHYLVTGGLGSIGLEVATCLASAGDVKLVLTGRSEFLAEANWDAWLTQHDDDDLSSLRISRLRELQAQGAQLTLEQADVGDAAAMARVIDAAEARDGPLHGVVHAAGADKGMILLQDTSRADMQAQFQPKLAGLQVLEQVLAGKPLDFCVVQSSLASVMGALGLAGYVAAHHYVDTFVARHNTRDSVPWRCVNWDNWLTWKEPELLHAEGQDAYFMTPEEGAQAFRRVLSLPSSGRLIVSTGDVEARIAAWSSVRSQADQSATDGAGQLHQRPDLGSAYEAPSLPAEHALVAVWGEVLGIGEIGVHDNFFELGGDSVLGLQIVARLARAGFRITPAKIFEHPTIAALAAVAESKSGPVADQGPVSGPAPLLPIQHWFFEAGVPEPGFFNLPMLFELPAGTQSDAVARALEDVVAWHDALRLRFRSRDGSMQQVHDDDAGAPALQLIDLSDVSADQVDSVMTEHADTLHRGFDLADGPLMAAAVFTFAGERPPELLWVVHHLVVDVVSWRVIVEDLQTALEARGKGQAPELPPKTTSFRQFGEALAAHATARITMGELDHWKALADAGANSLGCDLTENENDYASTRTVSVEFDKGQTQSLLRDVHSAYETRVDEVLLTALTLAASTARGVDTLLVDLEGHGREDIFEDVDLSRTVGWFTTTYPALLSVAGSDGPGSALKLVKEQVRGIPRHGIGHGLLRWMHGDDGVRAALASLPRPELSFLYLGQFGGQARSVNALKMRLLADVSGKPCGADTPRGHLLEVVGFVSDDRLRLELSYSSHRHTEQSSQALLNAIRDELVKLIEHCLAPDAGGHTPSDFPGARVSQASLDKLLSKIGRGRKGSSS